MLHQQLSRRRQADAAGGAVDEPRTGLGLERGDLARHGGLGERERLGRRGERSARGDLTEDTQAADVERHVESVYEIRTKIICGYGPQPAR